MRVSQYSSALSVAIIKKPLPWSEVTVERFRAGRGRLKQFDRLTSLLFDEGEGL